MRIWRRPSFLFLIFCLLVFGIPVALNIYKHVRYSNFTLAVTGNHGLLSNGRSVNRAVLDSKNVVFKNLRTGWWGATPSYAFTPKGIGPILAYPTVSGSLILTNPSPRANVAYSTVVMETVDGSVVQNMLPNTKYRLSQGDNFVVVQFHWDR